MKDKFIFLTSQCLQTAKEELQCALDMARSIKDPELTKQITELRDKTQGVKDYIVSKTDPKTLG